MNVRCVAAAVLMLSAACASGPQTAGTGSAPAAPSDQELASRLVGKWRLTTTVQGVELTGTSTYAADGTGKGEIRVQDDLIPPTSLAWTWKVADGKVHSVITESSNAEIMAVGTSSADRIVRLTSTEYVYVDGEGTEVTEVRIP